MIPIELKLLLLILIANGTPIMAASICGAWGARPLDGGRVLADGYRWLGDSKTWRGVLLAPLATGVAALFLLLPADIGIAVGAGAMLGDLLSSFIKRRLGLESSSMALGLDQIPEVLLPLLMVAGGLELSWSAIAWTVAGFVALELALSPVFFRLGIRNRPY
ncbi:MAG: CDP-archaeol synthase [Candidatus Competibacteraceae bacterium]|nr:CDP-archaeol synthase [Candidatus Competibacteraceae bacterium]MBK9952238.1 CDP-archaeol synthase [Candidatus Competibacteraceae bacterium]